MSRVHTSDRVLLLLLGAVWAVLFTLHMHNAITGRLAEPSVYVAGPRDPDGYPVVRSVRVGAPADTSGIEPGDELVRIGDNDLRGVGPIRFFAYAMQAMGPEQSSKVVLRRAGEVHERLLQYTPLPLPGRFIVVSLSFALIAFLLIFRAPGNRTAVVLFRAMLIFACGFTRPWGGPVEQTYAWLIIAVFVTPFFGPLLVMTPRTLRGDREESWLARAWPWLFLPVGPMYFSGILGIPLFDDSANIADPIAMAMLVVLGAVVIAELTISYRRGSPIDRRKIKWIVCGIYVSLVPVLIATIISIADPELWWLSDASEIFEVLIPLSIFVAIVRFNVFDIDRVISATASYSLLLMVVIPALILVVPMLADLLSTVSGIDPWPGRVVLSVGVVGMVVPAQRLLNPLIDLHFFPERHILEEMVLGLLDDLSKARTPTELAMESSRQVDEILRPESSASYVRAGDGYANIFVRGRVVPPVFEDGHPIVSVLRVRGRPIAADRWSKRASAAELSAFDRAALETLEAAVLVPVRRNVDLLAFMCLGAKRSGDIYTKSELALLGAVADKVAAELSRFDAAEIIRQSEEMQKALRRYVPAAVAEELESRDEIRPEEREITVLFVDIRGYSAHSEHRGADEIFSLVNRYTGAVSNVVRRHGGSIVDFNGDGLMAVFGAPRELASKERAGIEAGREILDAVGSIEVGEGVGRTNLSVGVGIATGSSYVGNIRAVDRLIWSAIGNTTNRAARLEALTRTLEVAMVIDAATWQAAEDSCADFTIRERVPIKGYSEPMDVFVLALGGS